jgi:hypothetical protein
MTALRCNISTGVPDGVGDEPIGLGQSEQWGDVPPYWGPSYHALESEMGRGIFWCDGFDMTVPEYTVKLLGFDNVWQD